MNPHTSRNTYLVIIHVRDGLRSGFYGDFREIRDSIRNTHCTTPARTERRTKILGLTWRLKIVGITRMSG